MKYIITEDQNNKLYNYIVLKYKAGESPKHISKMGIPLNIVVDAIMDLEIKPNEKESERSIEFFRELVDTLRLSKKLLNYFKYEDGSEIYLDYNSMTGSMSFDYGSKDGVRIYGYATLFYDGVPGIPVDMEEYMLGDEYEWREKNRYHLVHLFDKVEKIRTYRDLIRFRNEDYFILVKKVLDDFTYQLKQEEQ